MDFRLRAASCVPSNNTLEVNIAEIQTQIEERKKTLEGLKRLKVECQQLADKKSAMWVATTDPTAIRNARTTRNNSTFGIFAHPPPLDLPVIFVSQHSSDPLDPEVVERAKNDDWQADDPDISRTKAVLSAVEVVPLSDLSAVEGSQALAHYAASLSNRRQQSERQGLKYFHQNNNGDVLVQYDELHRRLIAKNNLENKEGDVQMEQVEELDLESSDDSDSDADEENQAQAPVEAPVEALNQSDGSSSDSESSSDSDDNK